MRARHLKNLKSVALQVTIFLLFVVGVSFFQTRHMASGQVNAFELEALNKDSGWVPPRSGGATSLIYFFAPWCGVCKLSMSNLNKLKLAMPSLTIQVVALDYETKDEVLEFVQGLGISVPVFYGNEDVRKAWRISAYPSYYVVD